MNKIKGYLIYSKTQTQAVADFLTLADGCEYTTIPAVESELIELVGAENLFDIEKAHTTLRRKPHSAEIAQTLSHIQCWKAIIENNAIAENDFVLIAEPTISPVSHYFTALSNHVESFLQGSHYQLALLQRSDNDAHWNKNIYSGEGDVNSIVFNLASPYNNAKCAMYLIRKSFIRSILNKLKNTKPHWLFHYFGEFCDIKEIVQLNKLLAVPHSASLQKFKKSNKPIFSVIVPVYNVERYLEQAVESILMQDFYDYEIILVNDSSTDNSAKICWEYAEKYPHITLISKTNGGLSETRNWGINLARGEYVMFLDSDDFWRHNHVFSDLFEIIKKKPVDYIISYVSSLIDETEIIEHIMPSDKLTGEYEQDYYELVKNKTFYGYAWIKTVKRELIIKHQLYFPIGLFYEDVQWSYFLAKNAKSYALYPSPYCMYRRERQGSISEFLSPKKISDMMTIFETCHTDLVATIHRDNIYRGLKLYLSNFGDYITLCHSKLFDNQKDELKPQFERFTKSLELLQV